MMRFFTPFTILISFYFLLSACSSGKVNITNDNSQFLPSNSVKILNTFPTQSYQIITRIDIEGEEGEVVFDLIRQMREEAMTLGADAIIPLKEKPDNILEELNFNPWINRQMMKEKGADYIIVSGSAIKFTK